MNEQKPAKSPHAEHEEKILAFWKEKDIFQKTLDKVSPKGEFVFYEGPPTANGRPGIHHLEARAFKDAIPRYRTMRGYHVRRKGGWDTHGLPVEIQAQKELGLKSKQEIEAYGIEKFNQKCKESVWTYVHEWEDFTERMGYWVDLKDPYITYKSDYIESLWNIIQKVDKDGLLYKDYRVVPWCPHDETVLSSHELAQGYEDVKDLSIYAKFKVKPGQKIGDTVTDDKTFFIAWTTTPWTLPGNVGLAVNEKIEYVKVRSPLSSRTKAADFPIVQDNVPHLKETYFILAKDLAQKVFDSSEITIEQTLKGSDLVGLSYEPLYPFEKDNLPASEKPKLANAFKVYAADFVTTADGTGIVHIAPMYGQDDFELGTKADLPKYHLVNEDGTFKKETDFLANRFVKDEAVAVDIIKDLAHRGLLFHKEKHEHSYPHCWRCHTPLIYYARDSWYIRMSELRHKLVKENEGINWEPAHIKEGRFGEWLREVKDWAISRERYWGTPLPIWLCAKCGTRKVIGSVDEIKGAPRNTFYVMRHGEAENNVKSIVSSVAETPHHLTELGKEQARMGAQWLKDKKIDLIFVSPFVRTRETAAIVAQTIGLDPKNVIVEPRIHELNAGVWNGKSFYDLIHFIGTLSIDARFQKPLEGGEDYADVKKRMGDTLYDIEKRYEGKNILFVTHDLPACLLVAAAEGLDHKGVVELRGTRDHFLKNAEVKELDFHPIPHNTDYELDLHRPYIDEVKLVCTCGGEMKRVKEVMDVWFDSGAMPFAQNHYPFEKREERSGKKEGFLARIFGGDRQVLSYPADFISEAIDQTRGWFYTLHAVGILMGKGKAYKNVISLGHILDAQGKKMSKSIGNVVDPWMLMDKYGADALRFWMYSVNSPGDSKNFDEKTVDEIIKKVFNLTSNVASFYKMYAGEGEGSKEKEVGRDSHDVLDRWIVARLDQLVDTITSGMEGYVLLEPTRAIRDFVADLSQWYLRRSRDRFKGGDSGAEIMDKQAALATTRYVLLTLAKVMAPFTPFFAEELYQDIGGDKESVHLEEWPTAGTPDTKLVADMDLTRKVASKGLEARMAAKINVRQPLSKLSVNNSFTSGLSPECAALIKDEVNVKEVTFGSSLGKDVELDLTITPALKAEGDLRELIRSVQDLRKEKGLKVGDKASLIVPMESKVLVDAYTDDIKKAASLVSIEIGDTLKLKD